jgi:hypothetical protein
MSVDLSGVNVTGLQANVPFDAMPSGWYNCVITSGERLPSKSGNGDLLKLELTVVDGPFQGRKIFDQLNLWNSNPTAAEIAHKSLKGIYDAFGVPGVNNIVELYNRPLKVKLKLKAAETKTDAVGNVTAQYDAKNDVSGYDSINSQHTMAVPAPIAPGVAGAPRGPTPWQPPGAAGPAAPQFQQPAPPRAPGPPQFQPPQPAMAAPVAPAPAAGGWQPPAGPAQPWAANGAAPPAPGYAAPAAPPAPLPPPPVAAFPPPGWTAHPAAPGYYYQGQEVVDEATLRARMAPAGMPATAAPAGPVAPPWAH